MARWLKHPSDWRSVLCIALWPLCVAALYTGRLPGWALGLVLGLLIYLSLALPVIEHNHMHLRLWRTHRLNRLTDTLLSALQGRPVFLFHPAHNANHHRYHHGPRDAARTYRFAGGAALLPAADRLGRRLHRADDRHRPGGLAQVRAAAAAVGPALAAGRQLPAACARRWSVATAVCAQLHGGREPLVLQHRLPHRPPPCSRGCTGARCPRRTNASRRRSTRA